MLLYPLYNRHSRLPEPQMQQAWALTAIFTRAFTAAVVHRQAAHLVHYGPNGAVLVQQHLPNDMLVGQKLIPKVEVCYVAHALKRCGNLTALG